MSSFGGAKNNAQVWHRQSWGKSPLCAGNDNSLFGKENSGSGLEFAGDATANGLNRLPVCHKCHNNGHATERC